MPYFDKKTISSVCVYSLAFSLASVLFSYFLSSLFLVLAFTISWALFDQSKLKERRRIWFIFIIALPFFLFFFSGLFSVFQENALSMLSKRLPLILIPTTFLNVVHVKKREFIHMVLFFSLACATIGALGLYNGVLYYFKTDIFFQPDYLSTFFKVQHVYLATYIVFCLIAQLLLYKRMNKREKILLIGTNSLNVVIFFLLSSKISLLILFVLLLLYFLQNKKKKQYYHYYILAFCFVLIVVRIFNPYWERIENFFVGYEPRIEIWPCAWNIIENNQYIGFTGLGDFQDKLNRCYFNETLKFDLEQYSAHSQYLEFWIITGFLGFLAYIFSLVYMIGSAVRHQKKLMFLTLVLITFFSLTESILGRQYGITFYTIIISFLTFCEDGKLIVGKENDKRKKYLMKKN